MATMSLAKIRGQLTAMRDKHKNKLEHAKRGFKVAGDALVINASSTLAGYLQGRYAGYKVGGHVPLEVLLAAGFYGVGVFGPKSAAHQFNNLGHGSLAAFTTAIGRGFGRQQRVKSGGKPLLAGLSEGMDNVLGEGSTDGGGTLSTADLMAMAERT